MADLSGLASHATVTRALEVLDALEHRGASGAEPDTGDGAGILIQVPHDFLKEVVDFQLPRAGNYAVGVCFLPTDDARRSEIEELFERTTKDEGLELLGWRDVPVDSSVPGPSAAAVEPRIRQVFVGVGNTEGDQQAFERKVYVVRRLIEKGAGADIAIPSFSSRTLVYKGMLTSPQLRTLLPGPARRAHRQRARAGPLALLDQHLPELGARAPVPLHRPQRRDQHAARQRQLDARARVPAASASCSATT